VDRAGRSKLRMAGGEHGGEQGLKQRRRAGAQAERKRLGAPLTRGGPEAAVERQLALQRHQTAELLPDEAQAHGHEGPMDPVPLDGAGMPNCATLAWGAGGPAGRGATGFPVGRWFSHAPIPLDSSGPCPVGGQHAHTCAHARRPAVAARESGLTNLPAPLTCDHWCEGICFQVQRRPTTRLSGNWSPLALQRAVEVVSRWVPRRRSERV
jgi:hypothetical protein